MANNSVLKGTVNDYVKQNGAGGITGQGLQTILDTIIDSLGGKYQYAGVAAPSTDPGTPDQNVFYLAATAGTYSNFGGIVLTEGEVAVLKGSGSSWTKEVPGIASAEEVSQLGQQVEVNSNVLGLQYQGVFSVTNTTIKNVTFIYTIEANKKYYIKNIGETDLPGTIASYDGTTYHNIVLSDSPLHPNDTAEFTAAYSDPYLRFACAVGTTTFAIASVEDGLFNSANSTNSIVCATNKKDFERTLSSGANSLFEYPLENGKFYYLFNTGQTNIPCQFFSWVGAYYDLYRNAMRQIEPGTGFVFQEDRDATHLVISLPAGSYKFSLYTIDKGLITEVSRIGEWLYWSGYDLSTQNWNAVGDSLTAGGHYQDWVKKYLGLNYTTYGVGGCTICINSNAPSAALGKSIVERVCGLNGQTAIPDSDIWTIFGGLNDAYCASPIGSISVVGSTFDNSTVYGALQSIVEHILGLRDNARLVFIIPSQSLYDTGTATTMAMVREAIIKVCELYSLPYVDLWTKSGINHLNIQRASNPTTYDGVHWSAYGRRLANPLIVKGIMDAYFLMV